MAKSSKIRVMISSRCNDRFPTDDTGSPTLSDIRKQLKKEIETLEVFGENVFEVWINEETPPQGGTWDSREVCLEAVKDCDVLVVLSNGDAGWAKQPGETGICHAELETGLMFAPGKVWLISLAKGSVKDGDQGKRNKRFQDFVEQQSFFNRDEKEVNTADKLKTLVKGALHNALITLTQRGVREASKGRFHAGQALAWNRMDFSGRQKEMMRVLQMAILERVGSRMEGGNVFVKLASTEVLMTPHAIPAALSVGPAKEMVGQPFLRDHEQVSVLTGKRGGPVHVIACQKNASESQAAKLLGFPDATVVNAPFGIYVADNVQKVQFAFIVNCRDEFNTRHGVQRFFEWLGQTGEDLLMAKRAQSRAKIVRTIAAEVDA